MRTSPIRSYIARSPAVFLVTASLDSCTPFVTPEQLPAGVFEQVEPGEFESVLLTDSDVNKRTAQARNKQIHLVILPVLLNQLPSESILW